MNGEVESEYLRQLNDDDKKWYNDKMTKLGQQTDPYLLPIDQWLPDRFLWPSVEYLDTVYAFTW